MPQCCDCGAYFPRIGNRIRCLDCATRLGRILCARPGCGRVGTQTYCSPRCHKACETPVRPLPLSVTGPRLRLLLWSISRTEEVAC